MCSMRSNSLNPGFLLFSLDIPSISRAWVDEKKFCSGFPFSPFCRKYVQILGRIFGIYQISQAGAAHRTKAGQKNCRQEPPPKPAVCKKPAAQTDSRKWFCAIFDLPIYVFDQRLNSSSAHHFKISASLEKPPYFNRNPVVLWQAAPF